VNFYPQNKFCELGKKDAGRAARCEQFQLTRDPYERRDHKRRCKIAREYFAKLDR
jgi:hypothetical protein